MFRATLPILAALVVAVLLPARPARAALVDEPDESKKWATVSFGPRFFLIEQEEYRQVYDPNGYAGAFQLAAGFVPVSRYVDVEVEFGVAFVRKCGRAVNTETIEASEDRMLFGMFPLSAGVVVGVDPVREFPVVPFGRLGVEVVPWKEHDAEVVLSDEESPFGEVCAEGDGSRENVTGIDWTWHYGFGVALLLDRLEPARAAGLDARAGINDTYLVIEARRTSSFPGSALGIDLGSWSFLASIKFTM